MSNAQQVEKLLKRARGLLKKEDFNGSLAAVEEAISLDPGNDIALKLKKRIEKAKSEAVSDDDFDSFLDDTLGGSFPDADEDPKPSTATNDPFSLDDDDDVFDQFTDIEDDEDIASEAGLDLNEFGIDDEDVIDDDPSQEIEATLIGDNPVDTEGDATFVGESPVGSEEGSDDASADDADFGEDAFDLGNLDDETSWADDSDTAGSGEAPPTAAEDEAFGGEDTLSEGFDFSELDDEGESPSVDADGTFSDEFDFDNADAFGDDAPRDASLGFDEEIPDDSMGDSEGTSGNLDDILDEGFDIGGDESQGETMGFEQEKTVEEDDDFLDATLQQDFGDFEDSGNSEGFYEDFGVDDEGGQFDADTASAEDDSLSSGDVDRVRSLWTKGAEQFREKDFRGCIQSMEEILQLDPNNDSAKGYIEMAREKLAEEAGGSDSAFGDDEAEGSVDLSAELLDGDFSAGLGESGGSSGLADDFLTDDTLSPNSPMSADLGSAFADEGDGDMLYDTLMKPLDDQGEPDIAEITGSDEMGREDDITEDTLSQSFISEPIIDDDEDLPEMPAAGKKKDTRKKSGSPVALVGILLITLVALGGGGYYAQQQGLINIGQAPPTPTPRPQPSTELQGRLEEKYEEAVNHYNAAKFDLASKLLEEIENAQPGVPKVGVLKQTIDQHVARLQNDEGARARFEEISRLYAEGEQAFQESRYRESLEKMNAVLQLQPENQGALYFIRKAQEELQRQKQEAERRAQISRLVTQAETAYAEGNYSRAVRLSDQALEYAPDMQQALVIRDRASTDLASQRLGRINVLLDIGTEHFEFERYKSCMETMAEVLSLDPENQTALRFRDLSQLRLRIAELNDEAQALFDEGEYQASVAKAQEVLALEPNNERANQITRWNEKALKHMEISGVTEQEARARALQE